MSLPWPLLLEELGVHITQAANSKTPLRPQLNAQGGDDDFRLRLWEEGFVCDALDTMNQWYFAIVLKSDRSQNNVHIHYDGWPSRYDEWIDIGSHRLQPFQTRARLSQRPCITRPHPSHAVNSINLDSLLSSITGEGISPPTAQFQPSDANRVTSTTDADMRQLSFEMSSWIATLSEQQQQQMMTSNQNDGGRITPSGLAAAAPSSALSAAQTAQLHSFSVKLQKALGASSSTNPLATYIFNDLMQKTLASTLPLPVSIPTSISFPSPTAPGGELSGPAAIAAALSMNALPSPNQFIQSSLSSLSCLAEQSYRNQRFLTEIETSYLIQYERNFTRNIKENFVTGFSLELMNSLPEGQSTKLATMSEENNLPMCLRMTPAASSSSSSSADLHASLSVCSYLISMLQSQLSKYTLQAIPPLIPTIAAQPHGSIFEMRYLVALNLKEVVYYQALRAFLIRCVQLASSPSAASALTHNGVNIAHFRQVALGTYLQFVYAQCKQDGLVMSVRILCDFFKDEFELDCDSTKHDPSTSHHSSAYYRQRRELLLTLCSLTRSWSRGTLMSSYRQLGQQREEVASGLSEARFPSATGASVAGKLLAPLLKKLASSKSLSAVAASAAASVLLGMPLDAALQASSSSSASSSVILSTSLLSTSNPAPASLMNVTAFQTVYGSSSSASASLSASTPLTSGLVVSPDCRWLFVLTSDFGLLKIATGESGTVIGEQGDAIGRIRRANGCMAVHAGYATLAYLPAPLNQNGCGYSCRGMLLMRSMLVPRVLLGIDVETLKFNGVEFEVPNDEEEPYHAAAESHFSWTLSYSSSASTASSSSLDKPIPYSPDNPLPITYPPTWQRDIVTVGFVLDVCDSRGDWYPGQIVSVDESMQDGVMRVNSVTVQFDGWSAPQYNERIPINANPSRLAPFGSRINPHQRFSKSNQQGDHLIDLGPAMRNYARLHGREIFSTPNLNTPAFQSTFRDGLIVDARDSSEMWYAAEIVKVDPENVTVRYDAWSTQYNEVIPRNSPRLAPFCSITTLSNRMRDPQQQQRFALNLDQAIAEVRGRQTATDTSASSNSDSNGPLSSSVDQILASTSFLTRFSYFILRSSSFDIGDTLELTPGNPLLVLLIEQGGFIIVDKQNQTRKRCQVCLVAKEGRVMTKEEEENAEREVASAITSVTDASTTPSSSSSLSSSTAPTPATPLLLNSITASQIRATLDAGLPFFLLDRGDNGRNSVELMLTRVVDGTEGRYRISIYSMIKISVPTNMNTARPTLRLIRHVQLNDRLPMEPLLQHHAQGQGTQARSADADLSCRYCGTFVTPSAACVNNSTSSTISHIAANSPGVRGYLKCTIPTCEKSKLLLCFPCQAYSAFPAAHDSMHQVMPVEYDTKDVSAESPKIPYTPILLSTRPQQILGIFDPRDESLLLGSAAISAAAAAGASLVRPFDFRGFSLADGRLLSATTPQSSAVSFALYAPSVDYSFYRPHTHPALGAAVTYRVNRNGMIGRSVWSSKRQQTSSALYHSQNKSLVHYETDDDSHMNRDLLLMMLRQILNTIPIVEDFEHTIDHLGSVVDAVEYVTQLYSQHRTYVESLFIDMLRLLSGYLNNCTYVWSMIRRENPILPIGGNLKLFHERIARLKVLLIDGMMMNELAAKNPIESPIVHGLLTHICMQGFALFYSTWFERVKFLHQLIQIHHATPASFSASSFTSSSSSPPLSTLLLHHLLRHTFQSPWLSHSSTSAAGQGLYGQFEFTTKDLAIQVIPASEEKGSVNTKTSSLPSSQSIFSTEFREMLVFFLDYSWHHSSGDNLAHPTVVHQLVNHLLISFQYHLFRVVSMAANSTTNTSQLASPAVYTSTGLVRAHESEVLSVQSKSCFDLLLFMTTNVIDRLATLIHNEDSHATSLVIHSSYHHLFLYTTFILARIDLQSNVSADILISLLPRIFWCSWEISKKYLPKLEVVDEANATASSSSSSSSSSTIPSQPPSLSRQSSSTMTISTTSRPSDYTLLISTGSEEDDRDLLVSNTIVIQNFSNLLRTSLMQILKAVYMIEGESGLSASETSSTMTKSKEQSTVATSQSADSVRLSQLIELNHIKSTPLSPVLQNFLDRFLAYSSLSAPSVPSTDTPHPSELLHTLIHTCLNEMGGGSSRFDLSFAREMESSVAALLMRYMSLASDGTSNESILVNGTPMKKDSSSSSSSSPTLLLDACFHFSHSLDIHVLLSKSQHKNLRLLLQNDVPTWMKQLITIIFENVRRPILEKMRQMEQEIESNPQSSSSVDEEKKGDSFVLQQQERESQMLLLSSEMKEEEIKVNDEEKHRSPPVPVSSKLQANESIRAYVKRLHENARFLLFHDFTGTNSGTSKHLLSPQLRFQTPKIGAASSPSASPISFSLGDVSLGPSAAASPILIEGSTGPLKRQRSSSITSGIAIAIPTASKKKQSDDDSDDSEDDDEGGTSLSMTRTLSDHRLPGSSPLAMGSSVFGQSPPTSNGGFLQAPHAYPLTHAASNATLAITVTQPPATTATHSLYVRRTRRSPLLGSSAWIINLLATITPQDQTTLQLAVARSHNTYRLSHARLELLKLINTLMEDEAIRPASDINESNLMFDEFLPMLWAALTQGAVSTSNTSTSNKFRMHLLYPSLSLCEMSERAHARQLRDSNLHSGGILPISIQTSLGDDHTTLLVFLKHLAEWLDTTVRRMDDVQTHFPTHSPLYHQRVRLVCNYLSQEFHSTSRDKSVLFASGVLASLVRFAFHPRIMRECNELSRITWTVFSYLIGNVLIRSGTTSGPSLSDVNQQVLDASRSSAELRSALLPLHTAILTNLSYISVNIPNFNSYLLLPPSDMLVSKTRYVPPVLDTNNLRVDQIVDAMDKVGTWYPARIVKLEHRLGGQGGVPTLEAWVQFSGWAESNNEYISVKSGKLATLFTHVSFEAYEQSLVSRPNKYKIDLTSQIAEYKKARTSSPYTTEEMKKLAKRHCQDVQVTVNETILLTINMIRIVCSASVTSGIMNDTNSGKSMLPFSLPASITASSSSSSSPFIVLSSFLNLLASPASERPIPPLLQIELLQYIKKSFLNVTLEEWDAAVERNANDSNLANLLTSSQVLRLLLRLLGSSIWTCRPSSSQPSMENILDSFLPDTPNAQQSLTDEAWLSQNFFDTILNETDGKRRMQENTAHFLLETLLRVDENKNSATGKPSRSGWSKLLVSIMEESILALPTVVTYLSSTNTHSPSSASSSTLSSVPERYSDDTSFYLTLASMRLLSGFERHLVNGSRVAVKLNEEIENVDIDEYDVMAQRMAPPSSSSTSVTPQGTSYFDSSSILHGYVSTFNSSTVTSNGYNPIMSVELLRELDQDDGSSSVANENRTNLENESSGEHHMEALAGNASNNGVAHSSRNKTTMIPTTLSSIRLLQSRRMQLSHFVDALQSERLKDCIVKILKTRPNDDMESSSSLMLQQIRYESLRILSGQIANKSWSIPKSELIDLLRTVEHPKLASPSYDPTSNVLPRTDIYFQALSLLNSRAYQLESDYITKSQYRLRIPSCLNSVANVPLQHVTGAANASVAPVVEVDLPQPDVLVGIDLILSMGYPVSAARAAFIQTGRIDPPAALELILGADPSINRIVFDAEWNTWLEGQGLRAQVEAYMKQQLRKKTEAASVVSSLINSAVAQISGEVAAASSAGPSVVPAVVAPPAVNELGPDADIYELAAPSQAAPPAGAATSPRQWACTICSYLNPAEQLLCEMCSAARPPQSDQVETPIQRGQFPPARAVPIPSSFSSTATPSRSHPLMNPESLFLGPWAAAERDLHSSLVTRTPMTHVVNAGVNIIGCSVCLKAPSSNIVPSMTLYSGLIVRVAPVYDTPPATDGSSQPSAIRGMVLVRFAGVLSSMKPSPSVYVWLTLSDLFLDTVSPFDLAKQATILAMRTEKKEIERMTTKCLTKGMDSIAKEMMKTMARDEMKEGRVTKVSSASTTSSSAISSSLIISPSSPHFSLRQLISCLPLLSHPMDSMPSLLKAGSKNRMKMIEEVAAYHLLPASSDQFDSFMTQVQEVLQSINLRVDHEVQLPMSSNEAISLVSLHPSSLTPSQSGLVSFTFRSDAWNSSLNRSNILSFYSDSSHMNLLKQIVFPSADETVKYQSTPIPFVLQTPIYVTYTDLSFQDLIAPSKADSLLKPNTDVNASSVLQHLFHATPWTVAGMSSISILLDIATYLLSNGAKLNGLAITWEQKREIHSRIVLPLFMKLSTFLFTSLLPGSLLPSNLSFVTIKFLTQILTIWSHTRIEMLPTRLRTNITQGQINEVLLASTPDSQRVLSVRSGTLLIRTEMLDTLTLLDHFLLIDTIVYHQLLVRYPAEAVAYIPAKGNNSSACPHSSYLLHLMESMTSFRLFIMSHAPLVTYESIWHSSVHLHQLLSPVQIEASAERTRVYQQRLTEFNTWSGARDGVVYEMVKKGMEEAKQKLSEPVLSIEMKLVRNMVKMIRRAQGKSVRAFTLTQVRSASASPTIRSTAKRSKSDASASASPGFDAASSSSSSSTMALALAPLSLYPPPPSSVLAEPSEPSSAISVSRSISEAPSMSQQHESLVNYQSISRPPHGVRPGDESSDESDEEEDEEQEEEEDEDAVEDPFDVVQFDLSASAAAAAVAAAALDDKDVSDPRTLLFFDLSVFAVFSLILPCAGVRWHGLTTTEMEEEHRLQIDNMSVLTLAPTSSSSSSISTRHPLAISLIPSRTTRLQLFQDLLASTQTRDRTSPEFAFDTSQRWQDTIMATDDSIGEKNRMGKSSSSSASGLGVNDKLSMFEQLCGQLTSTNASSLRGPNGEYSWRTSLVGAADEGAQGYVGMFKQCMNTISTQLVQGAFRSNALTDSLLIPCPNGLEEVGSNRNKLILNPNLCAVKDLKKYYGFGQLVGMAIRSSTCLALDMSSIFWKLLLHGVDGILSPHDANSSSKATLEHALNELQTIDYNTASTLRYILDLNDEQEFNSLNLTYTTLLSGGITLIDLFPGGSHVPVTYSTRLHYVRQVLSSRLNESCCAYQAIRYGIRSILPSTQSCFSSAFMLSELYPVSEFLPTPSGIFSLLTHDDLELLVCGEREIDLALLKKHTTYKNTSADSPIVQHFWQILESYSTEDRARFLQFAWGRSRLPANFGPATQHMTLNILDLPSSWRAKYSANGNVASSASSNIPAGPVEAAASVTDAAMLKLPKSQTCFFIVDLPNYPNIEILRHKLTLALGCTDINF